MVILIFGTNYRTERLLANKISEMRKRRRPDSPEVFVISEEDFESEADTEKRYGRIAEEVESSLQRYRAVIVCSACTDKQCLMALKRKFPFVRAIYISNSADEMVDGCDFYAEERVLHNRVSDLFKLINGEILLEATKAKKKFYNGFSQTNAIWQVNYQYGFAHPLIAKCASTQLLEWNKFDNDIYALWHPEVLNEPFGRQIGKFVQKSLPDGNYVKFAVYRDPLERFFSACLYPGYDARGAIKEFTEYTWENGVCMDQHMRRQSDFYNVEDIDYIVKLEDLNDFLDIKFNFDTKVRNRLVHPKFNEMDLTLTDEELQYVKNYYADDWKLLESDKVWVNPNK